MRIARFNGGRIGIVIGDTIRDVTAAADVDPAEWPPVGMVRVIAHFSGLRDKLAAAARSAPALPLADVRLETPVPWPNKIIAYPTNYRDHAAEMSTTTHADLQGYFLKANSSLSGPNDAIELPDVPGREIHHECEIALVIGKEGRSIPAARAFDHVFGYACLLDITIRGKEERVMRKSFDTFTPVGPWITTADEIPDPADIGMRLWVNAEKRQEASTKDLVVEHSADDRDRVVGLDALSRRPHRHRHAGGRWPTARRRRGHDRGRRCRAHDDSRRRSEERRQPRVHRAVRIQARGGVRSL